MKRQLTNSIHLILVLFLLTSCSSEDLEPVVDGLYQSPSSDNLNVSGSVEDADESAQFVVRLNESVFNQINTDRINDKPTGDSYTLNSASREGNIISLEVSYSGGCKNHKFELIWDGKVYVQDPSHVNFMLIHDADGDQCEAWLTKTFKINLEQLIEDATYRDSCEYRIFNSFNSSETPDKVVPKL